MGDVDGNVRRRILHRELFQRCVLGDAGDGSACVRACVYVFGGVRKLFARVVLASAAQIYLRVTTFVSLSTSTTSAAKVDSDRRCENELIARCAALIIVKTRQVTQSVVIPEV